MTALLKSAHDVSGESRGTDGQWVRGSGIPRVPPVELAQAYSKAIQSSAFKAWFGDWDEGEGSAVKTKDGKPAINTHTHSVVEEGGVPVTVFHGTSKGGFTAFDKGKTSSRSLWGPGFYFTQDVGVAAKYMNKDATTGYSPPPKLFHQYFMQLMMREKARTELDDLVLSSAKAFETSPSQENYDALFNAVSQNGLTFIPVGKDTPETKKAFLNIRHPLDVEAKIDAPTLRAIASHLEGNGYGIKFIDTDTPDYKLLQITPPGSSASFDLLNPEPDGRKLYKCAESYYQMNRAPIGKIWGRTPVIQFLKDAGFDGMTHIGGDIKGGGNSHRVWIAWEPNQIKAVDNEGTFDPSSADMYKGASLIKSVPHDVSGEKRDSDGKWTKLTEGLPPEAAEKVVQLAGVAEAIAAYKEKGTLAPKFIDWFGDWVNDKPKASKVLDADGKPAKSKPTHSVVEVGGKPVVVYHGTANGGFESFDKARQDPQSLFGAGFYFTQAEDVASTYKDKGMEITHLSRNATLADVKKVRAWLSDQIKNSKTEDNAAWCSNLLAHTESTYDLGLILGRTSLISTKFRAMLGIELISADNNQEVKHVYLNIRNPIDMDKSLTGEQVESVRLSLEAHGYKCKPDEYGGRTSYLAHAPGRKGVLRITQDGNKTGSDLFDEASSYFRSGQPLYDHKTDDKAMLETTQFLKDAGFDGITHIGGIIHGTKKHKVWIAFEPNQIKAVDNDGEFDPASDNIYKGVALSKSAHDVSGEKRDADGQWVRGSGIPRVPPAELAKTYSDAIQSSAFKAWFGDWGESKGSVVKTEGGKPAVNTHTHSVVEEGGVPVTVFHGTSSGGFHAFDKSKLNPGSLWGAGFYFTQDVGVADSYTNKDAKADYSPGSELFQEYHLQLLMSDKGYHPKEDAAFYQKVTAFQSSPSQENYDALFSAVSQYGLTFIPVQKNTPETKKAFLNIRNPLDIEKKIGRQGLRDIARAWNFHGEGPSAGPHPKAVFSLDNSGERVLKLANLKGENVSIPLNATGEKLYSVAKMIRLKNESATDVLKRMGFDGITHIGGGRVGKGNLHRVWIAWEPNQIKAIENEGTFDPANPDMYKGALVKSAHDVSGESRDKNGLWVRGSGIPRVPPAELAKTYSDAVQSSAFKAWFGDWDTGEGSKVKTEDGKPAVNTHTHSVVEEGGVPVVVFHGTSHGGFRAFDKGKLDLHALWGAGFYFTQDEGVGISYKDKGSVSAEILESDAEVMAGAEKYVSQKADVEKFAQTVAALTALIRSNDIPEMRGMFERNPFLAKDAGLTSRRLPQELKKAFLNIRKPLDLDAKIGEDGLQSIADAWNAGGEKGPDGQPAAQFMPAKEGEVPELSLWRVGVGESRLTANSKGADIYDEADDLASTKDLTSKMLTRMGFDGLTHIGGNRMGGGNSHRVWIAWEPNQIKAVENEGTFDPASPDMYKAANFAIILANCPPLSKGVSLEAEKQEHMASTPSGQLPAGQDAYAAMDLRLQQEMARCAMQYDGAREELATTHAGLGPKLKKAMQLMEKLRKPVELLLSGKGPGLTPKVAKACVAYLEAGAEVAKMKMAMRQSYPATVKPGEEKLGGVPGDGPVPDPDPDRLSKAAVAEARVPAGSPGGGRWTDGVLPIAGLEKYGKAKKPVNRKAFDPEVQYHPVTDEHFIKNDPRMILYHGDSRGGAVAPTQYDIYGASTGPASKDTHLDDIRGFYTAPQHNYAMRFTLRFSAKPGGGISAWRLDPSARIADEVELTTQFMGDEDFGHYTKLGHGSLLASLGLYAKDKGYDAILRRDDGADTDEYNPSNPPMSDAEVIVLNQSHLIPVGPGEDGVDMGPAPKKVMQGDFLNGNKKWDEVPLAAPPEDVVPPLYPDIPNALKGAQVLILDPAGVWSRVASTLLRKGGEGEGEKGDYVLAIASHPGSAKGQSVRGMSTEHNRTLHNIGYNSATKRIRTLDNLGIDHEVTDHLGHSSTSQWGLEPNMHIKLKGVTHESAQRVGAMFGKAFKQDGIGIAHTGTAATAGNHHEVLGVSKKDGSAYSLDEVNRAGEHAGRHGVSVETSEDHKRLDFHHYGGDGDSWEKGVRSTLHTAGMDGPQHQAAESAVSGEYLDRKDYETSLWGHSKVGGTRQPGAFVHAAQSLARSHTAALGGRSFGQHRPAGPHIPSVRRPGPTTMPGRY